MPGKKKETDAERAARRDAEAAAAAEAEVQRQAAAVERLRERAAKEDAYTRTNSIKINNHWRNLMRQAKTAELRAELDNIRQAFERALDRKDALIQALDADLEEAEEQWRTAVKGHSLLLDSLSQLQDSRLDHAKRHFTSSLQALKEEFEAEKVELISTHGRARKEMLEVQAAMESANAEAAAEARQEFEEAREELRNRASEEYNVLKLSLEGQIAELEATFKAAHQVYLQDTQEPSQVFKQLSKSDEEAAAVIEMRMKKLAALNEALAHWRAKISSGEAEWEARNRAIAAEKIAIARHHRGVNASMARARALQAAQLRSLSLLSTAAEKEVQQKLELGQQILQLGRLCHKFMREGERIQPFLSPHEALYGAQQAQLLSSLPACPEEQEGDGDEEEGGSGRREAWSGHALDLDGLPVPEQSYLRNLHAFHNKVLLDKMALEQEGGHLNRRREQLRVALQAFLDGVSVGPHVLESPCNALLDVNGGLRRCMQIGQGTAKEKLLPGARA